MGSSDNRGPEEAQGYMNQRALTYFADVVVSPSPSPPSVAGVLRLNDFFSLRFFD